MSKGFITGTNEELIKAYKESRDCLLYTSSIDKGWKDLYPLKNYGRQGKPTAVSKKFSGNTLKDAEGKDCLLYTSRCV